MSAFPVIAGVEQLIVLADHDLNGEGQAAADVCMQRWAQAGRAGVLLLPDRPGADFNDIVLEDAGAHTMSSGFTEQEFGPIPSPTRNEATATAPEQPGTDAAPMQAHATTDPWPVLGAAAYHGLAGEVVSTISPQTEADPVALLLQYLVYFGNAVGRGPYYQVETTGTTPTSTCCWRATRPKRARASRPGASAHIFETADPDWARNCIPGGMSSGEGILHAIRDPVYAMKKGVSEMTDPGVADKRLLLDEREFYSALAVMKREGNIVSRIVRDAWDCRPMLRTLTKNTHTRVTNGFISIVGHITIEELRQKLDHTSMANGYANRFLFACVHRSKMLPFGGDALDDDRPGNADQGRDRDRPRRRARHHDRGAKELWVDVYPQLSAERPGLLGAITARAEGQTIRLALIYALLDGGAARSTALTSKPRLRSGRSARPPRASSSATSPGTPSPTPSCARCAALERPARRGPRSIRCSAAIAAAGISAGRWNC